MRVLLFQERFVEAVRSGKKVQTIRKKARCQPGDVLSLRRWTGRPRWAQQEEILEAVCVDVRAVKIGMNQPVDYGGPRLFPDADAWARSDGFKDWLEMALWFNEAHGLPFEGELIEW
jgi:hypothetical protein